jgi:hypothetical protein
MDPVARFLEKGQKFIGLRKDFNDTLQDADDYGLTISPAAVAEIVRLGAPEVAYWLAKPENFEAAHGLMNMLEESGFARDSDTEDWIDKRKQAKREGKRR